MTGHDIITAVLRHTNDAGRFDITSISVEQSSDPTLAVATVSFGDGDICHIECTRRMTFIRTTSLD